jgi:antitoxin component YwqK of YwqJK toxin-antitoxin module
MRLFLTAVAGALIAFSKLHAGASNDLSYLDYSYLQIPCEKHGPIQTRDAKNFYVYLLKGAKAGDNGSLVAQEYFDGDNRIRLDLFKNEKNHGVQKEWHSSGVIKSESPYRAGIRHGKFQNWTEKAELVAEYDLHEGNGVQKEYYVNGSLFKERHFRENKEDGPAFEFYDNGQAKSLMWYKNGRYEGCSFAFEKNGDLRCLGFFRKGELDGPFVYFNPEISPKQSTLYLNGIEVDENKYVEARKKDSSLPGLVRDLNDFKKELTPEILQLVQNYKKLPRVKIPLRFDKDGHPILVN